MSNSRNVNVKHATFLWPDEYKSFDPNKIKIDEKTYKNILIYCNGYMTVKDLTMQKLVVYVLSIK